MDFPRSKLPPQISYLCYGCLTRSHLILPRSLSNSRNLTFVSQFTEANTAKLEFAVNGMWTSTFFATSISLRRELRRAFVLSNHRFFSQFICLLNYFAKGIPRPLSNSRPSSSEFAVVTITISIPRTLSTSSKLISGKINCSFTPSV